MDTKSLDRIKALTLDASALANFHEMFASKYADKAHYDKQNYGFNISSGEYRAFEAKVWFHSYAGTYGNSSVYEVLRMMDAKEASAFFIKAITKHQREIFATMAELMRKEAASLTDNAEKEISAMQQMLADVRSPLQPAEAA